MALKVLFEFARSMRVILVILFASVWFPACSLENRSGDQGRNIAIASLALAGNTFCNLGINSAISFNLRSNLENVLYPKDCSDNGNYAFDLNVFSPIVSPENHRSQDIFEETMDQIRRKFSIRRTLFSTSSAAWIDPKGYAYDPKMYDYSEYRAILLDIHGKPSNVLGRSELSIAEAFHKAVDLCKKEAIH